MKKYCLMVDLKDDPELIRQYELQHEAVWPEIIDSIKQSGITDMEIYRVNNRLVMIIKAEDNFTFEQKRNIDKNNKKVQEWEEFMWKFQQPLQGAPEGEKWILMKQIFSLANAV